MRLRSPVEHVSCLKLQTLRAHHTANHETGDGTILRIWLLFTLFTIRHPKQEKQSTRSTESRGRNITPIIGSLAVSLRRCRCMGCATCGYESSNPRLASSFLVVCLAWMEHTAQSTKTSVQSVQWERLKCTAMSMDFFNCLIDKGDTKKASKANM